MTKVKIFNSSVQLFIMKVNLRLMELFLRFFNSLSRFKQKIMTAFCTEESYSVMPWKMLQVMRYSPVLTVR